MSTTTARPAGASLGSAQQAASPGGFTHRQILTIISGLLLGMFLAALDQTVVSTAIRTISDDLKGYSLQAWATTAFLVTSTITTPLYGKLSDQFGRKPFYLTAIGIFVIGSMLCGTANSMYELAAFRAVQGLGAGGLMSLAFAILGDIVSPRERARYQNYFMAVFASSSVLGPVIGGVLAGQASILGFAGWRWIFYVNVPIGIAAFAVVWRVLRIPHTPRKHRIDWPGALTLTGTLVPLLIVAEQGREWGWDSSGAILCYAIGLVGLIGFLLSERAYGDEALIPLRLFRGRSFTVGVLASVVSGIGMFGGLALLPQYLQVVKGSSATVAGLQMIPLVLGIMVASSISGRVISRTGRYRIFPIIGTVLMVLAMIGFSLVSADTSLIWTMSAMFVFGGGLGLNMQPIILAVQNAAKPTEMGVATSSVTFFRQIGGTAGTAVFLSILFSTLPSKITSAVNKVASTPAYQEALKAHPDQAKTVKGAGTAALSDTSFISTLDATLAHPFKVGFTDAMDLIFVIAAAVLVIGVVLSWFLPELPLRTTGALQAEASALTSTEPDGSASQELGTTAEGDAADSAAADDADEHGAHAAPASPDGEPTTRHRTQPAHRG